MVQPFFSLVILCYKGGNAIVPFIEKAHRLLGDYNFPWEIILVANYMEGVEDPTPEVMRNIAKKLNNCRVLTLSKKGMMGWDLRSGMSVARGEYVGVIDGDGQFPIEALASCLAKIRLEGLDLVKTYRVRRDDGLYRKLISIVYNFLFRMLGFGDLKDANSKPKVIRRVKFEEMRLCADDWFVDAEIMIKAHRMGLKVKEIPIHFSAQTDRCSYVKPSAIFEFIKNLLAARNGRFGRPNHDTFDGLGLNKLPHSLKRDATESNRNDGKSLFE
ncbi:MAG: hypothetical protein COT74_11200 [Bdellovibrionales bacterium CG10_big_fil_rev_8_21_14_0_10_45_34]|nr:MAG: hypothetical protein COT74_11200 [Bdellovibrionales bacterium CG10_big_fil_rev_8_21_14_0_10_45_34]